MFKKNFHKTSATALAVMSAMAIAPASNAALLSYSQNWEAASPATDLVIGDGFVIGNVNVGTGGAWFDGFAAPNSAAPAAGVNGYSAFVTGEGDVAQGNNQLSIFSDYNPWSPFTTAGTTLQTFVIKDHGTIAADDVGKTYTFAFDGKLGNIDPTLSSANAFVKVLEQSTGTYNTLFEGYYDSTNLSANWSGGGIDITIDAGMVGELIQFGFTSTATDWSPSGVFYDNLNFAENSPVPVPAAVWLFGSGLIGLVGIARRRKG